VALFVVPLVMVWWTALTSPSPGLENFQEFARSPAARKILLTTLRISAFVTLLALLVGSVFAWQLRSVQSPVGRMVLWSAVLLPLWTSVVVRNYAWTILLEREGLVNGLLQVLHLTKEPIGILYTDGAVTVGILYSMLPYAVLPLYASFVNIDDDLLRAAESLGASRLRSIASVVLPLSLPSIFAAGAIVFVVSVGFYITPILLGGPSSNFLASMIDQRIFTLYDFAGGAATACVLLLIAVLVVGVAWRAVGFDRLRHVMG
jgi:ABC-type spermidine/putrescine transport system permease subunit I